MTNKATSTMEHDGGKDDDGKNAGSPSEKIDAANTRDCEGSELDWADEWTIDQDESGEVQSSWTAALHLPPPAPEIVADSDEGGTAASGIDGADTAAAFQLRIFDPDDLDRAVQGILGINDDDDFLGPDDERPPPDESILSSEEKLRLKRLRALAGDRRGPSRRLIRGTPAMVARLDAVKEKAAHFAPVIDLVIRAVHVAMATGTPLRLPPTLLLGEPGIGKTWAMKQVAAAIGSTVSVFPMNLTDSFRLRGLNTAWKGARPGRIAEALLASETASPIILLDELEKTPAIDRTERPFDTWHGLWEPETAATFSDDYYEVPLRCDHVIWIASANSTDTIPAAILDRLLVLPISRPNAEQVLAIIDGLYRAARERLGNSLVQELAVDVRAAMACHTPRRARRILELAIGFMAADNRMALSTADVARAARLAKDNLPIGTFRYPVGFKP